MKAFMLLAVGLCVCALPAGPAAAGGDREVAELEKIAKGLLHGVKALDALGRKEEAGHLEGILREVKEKIAYLRQKKGGRSERETAKRSLEILRPAFTAMREAGKNDAMDILEHAIHARELGLEGRKDREARKVRESAPKAGVLAELLMAAGRIWREFKHPGNAECCEELGRFFAKRAKGEKERGHGGDREREIIKKHIEILKIAAHGLREAEKPDLVERMEHAIHARKLALEGRKDREAVEIRESAPNFGQLAEILHYAADLWAEFKNEDRAHSCRELGDHYGEVWRKHREQRERHEGRGEREREEHRRNADERVEQLRRQVAELSEILERVTRELEEIRREMK